MILIVITFVISSVMMLFGLLINERKPRRTNYRVIIRDAKIKHIITTYNLMTKKEVEQIRKGWEPLDVTVEVY